MSGLEIQTENEQSGDENIEFEKYSSLIHILKYQEEFWLNTEGLVISSNLEAVNITGYEEYEILGKHISVFYLPEEKEKAKADLGKALNIGQSFVTGLRVKKRGATFWAKMKITSLDSNDPKKPKFKVILQDATHRALSNLRVRTIKDEYLAIFNNPFVGSFKFKMADYRIQMCNQKTIEITGKRNSANLYFDSFFNSAQQFNHFIDLLKLEKRVDGFKFLIKDNKTEDNWGVISARFFKNKGFAEGVLFDISEQHTQMMELKHVNTELDNIMYRASHDLRAPISSALGLVNLGLMEKSTERIHSYLEMIGDRMNHLDKLLNDLKTVSFNKSSQLALEIFDFKLETEAILRSFGDSNQQFEIDINVQQEIDFVTDTIRVKTILNNLLSNAFKYYNPAIKTPYIKLNVRVSPRHAIIQLKDNGIGIEWRLKERIFDMFFRGTPRSTGTGLGLYIVKSMIDKLDGRISFESTLHNGTTFLLSIPNLIMHVNKAQSVNKTL